MSKSDSDSIFKNLGDIGQAASHVHSGLTLLGSFFGKEPPKGDEHKIAQGIHGIFGGADERGFNKLLTKIGKISREDRQIFERFYRYIFPKRTWAEKRVADFFGNRFREHIVKMAEDGKDEEELDFLLSIVEDIRDYGENEQSYDRIRDELRARKVPFPPKDADKALEEMWHKTKKHYRFVRRAVYKQSRSLEQQLQQRTAQPKPWYHCFIHWI